MARLLIGLLIFVTGLITYVLWGSGITRSIEHRFAGTCRTTDMQSAEDIVFEPGGTTAWAASIEGPQAGLYTLRTQGEDSNTWVLAKLQGIEPFMPLGLSVWIAPSGEKTLFVINRTLRTVEIFSIEGFAELRHLRTVQHPLIRFPNDLTATGPDSFYVSNTHESAPGTFARSMEMVLRLERGDVVHVDGRSARIVAEGIGYANGNTLSPDGQTFYVSSVSNSKIHRFRRSADNSLERIDSVATPGGPDNLDMRPDGSFTAALHPRMLDALRFLSGNAETAPSRVIRVIPTPEISIETIYEDPGEELSAASIAATSGNRLLIGVVTGDHLLDCTVNEG